MSLLYLIAAGFAVWLLWRIFSLSASGKPGNPSTTYEIPIRVKATYEADDKTRSPDTDQPWPRINAKNASRKLNK